MKGTKRTRDQFLFTRERKPYISHIYLVGSMENRRDTISPLRMQGRKCNKYVAFQLYLILKDLNN